MMYWCDIPRAEEVLKIVNERVAGIFKQPVKSVKFVFVSYISNPKKSAGVCLGLCVYEANEIQLRIGTGWQTTAIHELVHLYNPNLSEKKVGQVTNDVVKYLRRFKK